MLAFFTVIAVGMTAKLAWDRWGWLPVNKPPPPRGAYPLWFLLAALVALVLLGFTVREFLAGPRAARGGGEEVALERVGAAARLELDT